MKQESARIRELYNHVVKSANPDETATLERIEAQIALIEMVLCDVRCSRSKAEVLSKLNDVKAWLLALEYSTRREQKAR